MLIHLIRHTQPDIETGTCYGQSDIPLAKSFETEKQIILNQLNAQYDAVFTSPLSRCTQLAQQIPTQYYQTDERLLEMDFGVWELKNWNDIQSAQYQLWLDDFVNQPAEQGESFVQLYQRVTNFLEQLAKADHETVAIVSHAGVIRVVWSWLLDIPLQNTFRLQVKYGDICSVRLNEEKIYCSIYQGIM
ncbi:alpha-ribazole phosphatase [Candidatus Albibeggiatoa sp. nov. NOAA]|uniref:alpha-ribazole phosphatase n=1 Tax=Candidatus Albibeggiatoa sp. nov. NOAA TaxID=3162724 RepID=UPI00330069EF|nr:alpha-ribazole phosphatase [Thiotrichaceae bacterium]